MYFFIVLLSYFFLFLIFFHTRNSLASQRIALIAVKCFRKIIFTLCNLNFKTHCIFQNDVSIFFLISTSHSWISIQLLTHGNIWDTYMNIDICVNFFRVRDFIGTWQNARCLTRSILFYSSLICWSITAQQIWLNAGIVHMVTVRN